VHVKSRRGNIVLRAHASAAQRPGSVFIAMHWGRNVLSSSGANALTAGRIDPHSKQPELKHAAVQLVRAELPHQALLLRTEANDEAAVSAALSRPKRWLRCWLASPMHRCRWRVASALCWCCALHTTHRYRTNGWPTIDRICATR
jgi:hypothetical protein